VAHSGALAGGRRRAVASAILTTVGPFKAGIRPGGLDLGGPAGAGSRQWSKGSGMNSTRNSQPCWTMPSCDAGVPAPLAGQWWAGRWRAPSIANHCVDGDTSTERLVYPISLNNAFLQDQPSP